MDGCALDWLALEGAFYVGQITAVEDFYGQPMLLGPATRDWVKWRTHAWLIFVAHNVATEF